MEFLWPDGRIGKHTFDALRVDKNGLRVAIDVKLKNRVVSSGIEEIQQLIKEQVGTDFADVYVIRTEEHIHEDDVADAELALRAFQFSCATSDAVIAGLIAGLHGWCRVRDLVAAAGMGANGCSRSCTTTNSRVSRTSMCRCPAWLGKRRNIIARSREC
ncbi:MAG: hypothetical protein ABJN75_11425 [Hoeflea sp.]|uniref:hypothetical protein n=1 Tax=Hoeflea sp. TaxID=1940281 RepID=UPI0032980D63